ncbi:3-hydroxyacyl-CoA dehydrogenase [Capsaspora owczarzaki ATCC 30864]|uniref:3-hydroxyacyl-CoA dehydrogenase n=1 Tax=Capsaspora owczarzaki (strain ATCC 30864) TaxID=595528 RepID=A0A0D2U0L1_CAPO3|nr:3-hydroxyacyl-CoA dehydrogenase [Capsaspora owczarzaki ATCC 30864]KJE88781.1 3-hydroxyacyl-CoA dehydrogenase [Capsaspora owczarzaki ATCC 30864]|eukprot:XP_004365240.1 3-hydroxyacyl-CoA dehydrogenase [Capsaspora owczarzaki ATCC 30864]
MFRPILSQTAVTRAAIRSIATSAASANAAAPGSDKIVAPVRRLGVIGAGQMGIGIAQVAAQVAKIPVTVMDVSMPRLQQQLAFVDSLLAKNVAKGKMQESERKDIVSRFTLTTDIKDFASADFVVEAVSEKTDLKLDLFRQLSEVTSKDTILASNTSSISITKIASVTKNPENVIGVHFMNPVPVMKLVEIISGLQTSPETLQRSLALATAMGKTTATSQDVPGFIANRLLMPFINEAVFALQDGLGTREDIDATCRLGFSHPMGPLTLADFIGLDTCLAIMQILHSQLGDSKYRPANLLVKYVEAGWLGKKSGRGFYKY